jgi:hypothetical protein
MVPARLQELVDSLGLPESSTNRLDIMRLVVSRAGKQDCYRFKNLRLEKVKLPRISSQAV